MRVSRRGLFPVAVVVWLVGAACGGRALGDLHDGGTAGQGSDAAAGTSGRAGATAGSTGSAGATGSAGTTGVAGMSGGGGQGGAGGTICGTCPPIACKPGFVLTPSSISCCPVCKPVDCALVDCAAPACADGMHAETPSGQCCPVCMPGTISSACKTALADYDSSRGQLIEKYKESSCQVDSDCVLITESNRCHEGCEIAFPKDTASFFLTNQHTQDMQCSVCPQPIPPPCTPVVALCSNGQCTEASPR